MFSIQDFPLFLLSAMILNMTPGTDTMYIVARSVSQGRKAGILSVLGISSGSIIHTIAASVGISAVIASSAFLFSLIKWIGAGYLFYLGAMLLFRNENNQDSQHEITKTTDLNSFKIYQQGLLTNVLNPKVAIFFLAFLPQFVDPKGEYQVFSYLLLGGTFIFTGTIWCLGVAYFSSLSSQNLRSNPKIKLLLNKVTGLIFMSMGVKLIKDNV